jgi:hypothetical protein
VTADADPNQVELGVKFKSAVAGDVTAIRYYKSASDTGTHVVDLWDSSGDLLASATASGETASGWQNINLSTPVAIAANTTYVASFHSNGDYAATPNFFTSDVVSGDLTAPAAGNGVYAYGPAGTFPTSTFNKTSYLVDVAFHA